MAYKLKNDSSFHSEWSRYSNKNILPALILYYTTDLKAKPFNEEYEKLEDTASNEMIKLNFSKWVFNLSPALYRKLLEVVEMVVPY